MIKYTVLLLLILILAGSPAYGNSFTCNGDGTVTDAAGLQWMKCSIGQSWEEGSCKGEAAAIGWNRLPEVTGSFSFAGKNDWRLPTIDELYTLVYCSSGEIMGFASDRTGGSCIGLFENPTLDQKTFPNTPDEWFWSSTSAGSSGSVYYVSFHSGGIVSCCNSHNAFVRLVRTGR